MRRISRILAGAAMLVSMLVVAAGTTASAAPLNDRGDSGFKHIFVIMMENHATNQHT